MGIVNRIIDRFSTKVVDTIVSKTAGSSAWSRLFETGRLNADILGNTVTQPYKQVANVYKAIKAIADNVPQAELCFYSYSDDRKIEAPDELQRLLDTPNPLMSGSDFIQAIVGYASLYGECFIIKVESIGQKIGTTKLPAELWTFNPSYFQELIEDKQLVGWRYHSTHYQKDEVIFFRDFNPYSNLRGLAPVDVIRKTIDIDWQSLIYNKAFFDNFAQLGTVFSTDAELSENQVKRFMAWLEKTHSGASKAFRSALFDHGIKPTQAGLSPKDMDFIEQKKFTREEIIGIWRAPKAMFSMTEDLNYATFMGQMKVFWLYAIQPILRKVEDAFNRGLIQPYDPNIYCRFDISNVPAFAEDFKDKVGTAQMLFNMGFTANEVNDKLQLGFEPKPWRDYWWIPFTQAPAGEESPALPAAEQQTEASASAPKSGLNAMVQQKFFKNHVFFEIKLTSSLRRFFFEQRKRALDNFLKSSNVITQKLPDIMRPLDWSKEDEELMKRMLPHLLAAVKAGVDFARALTREEVNAGLVSTRISELLLSRATLITRINRTIKQQIAAATEEGLRAGETINQIADRIRDVYNMAHARALTIARTEVTGALNGGNFLYCDLAGVKTKRWLTARDEYVRDSHRVLEGEEVDMSSKFSNGLDYPGADGPPEEVINCRCSWIPVMEK